MQRYPFKKAHELYESVILTMQFLNEVKAAGIKEERAWEVLTLSAAIDCHNGKGVKLWILNFCWQLYENFRSNCSKTWAL